MKHDYMYEHKLARANYILLSQEVNSVIFVIFFHELIAVFKSHVPYR